MSKSQTTGPRGSSDAEYIRLTDLTKLRIARDILYSVMPRSLAGQGEITTRIYAAIVKLEALNDDD